MYILLQLRGEFLKETKVCTIISARAGPSNADEDGARDTLVTKQVPIIIIIIIIFFIIIKYNE